jgi:putative flippase GtrA
VHIVRTALDDLRGVVRLAAAAPLARFLGIGVLSTLAFALVYLLLRAPLGAAGANAAALALTAIGNTAANRRLTFGLRGRTDLARHHLRGAAVFVLALALSNGALSVLHGIDASPPRAVELTVLVLGSALATVTRYVALKTWVFTRRAALPAPPRARRGRVRPAGRG